MSCAPQVSASEVFAAERGGRAEGSGSDHAAPDVCTAIRSRSLLPAALRSACCIVVGVFAACRASESTAFWAGGPGGHTDGTASAYALSAAAAALRQGSGSGGSALFRSGLRPSSARVLSLWRARVRTFQVIGVLLWQNRQ